MEAAAADLEEEFHTATLRWVEGAMPLTRRTACIAGATDAVDGVWADLAALGMLGLMVPESSGGVDVGPAGMIRVAEAFGQRLMPEPWAPVAVGSAAILRAAGDEARLAALAAGETRPVPAWTEPGRRWSRRPLARLDAAGRLSGAKTVVWGAAAADTVIVTALDPSGEMVLALAPAESASRRGYRMWDGCDAAELTFDRSPVQVLMRGSSAEATLVRALDLMTLALCGEALGAMARALDLTMEHLRTRVQFGRPLAANQALRHRLAEAWVEAELARALTVRAGREFETLEPVERTRMTAAAKAQSGVAARLVAAETVQMHGGIGITDEAEISHLHRRLVAIDLMFGSVAVQLAWFRGAA